MQLEVELESVSVVWILCCRLVSIHKTDPNTVNQQQLHTTMHGSEVSEVKLDAKTHFADPEGSSPSYCKHLWKPIHGSDVIIDAVWKFCIHTGEKPELCFVGLKFLQRIPLK